MYVYLKALENCQNKNDLRGSDSKGKGSYGPGEFFFQGPVFLPFHTVHGVLKTRILKWFAIPFSSGPHSVKSLHQFYSWIYSSAGKESACNAGDLGLIPGKIPWRRA